MPDKTKKLWPALLLAASMSLTICGQSRAQDPAQDEDARRLWDGEFLKKRAAAKKSSPDSPARKTTGYRRVAPKNQASQSPAQKSQASQDQAKQNQKPHDQKLDAEAGAEMIGVTIWRLRAARAADDKDARLLLEDEESKEAVEWTPERVEAETTFAAGDRVRLGIESPRDGYLYVIDRERYADGSMSDPYLIFPTLRNRGGDNSVKAGKLVELPGRNAFRLKPLRPDYAGEVLTVLVTPEPLAEIKVGASIVKLEAEMVARWESQWQAQVEQFELIGGAGKPYTKAEKEAGQERARILTQDDELPQTLYRVIAKRGSPLLISVPLRIGK